jgi:hypothetical protein
MGANNGLESHQTQLMEPRPISSIFPTDVCQASNRTGEAHVDVVETNDSQIQGLIANGMNYVGQSLFNSQIAIADTAYVNFCQFIYP